MVILSYKFHPPPNLPLIYKLSLQVGSSSDKDEEGEKGGKQNWRLELTLFSWVTYVQFGIFQYSHEFMDIFLDFNSKNFRLQQQQQYSTYTIGPRREIWRQKAKADTQKTTGFFPTWITPLDFSMFS